MPSLPCACAAVLRPKLLRGLDHRAHFVLEHLPRQASGHIASDTARRCELDHLRALHDLIAHRLSAALGAVTDVIGFFAPGLCVAAVQAVHIAMA